VLLEILFGSHFHDVTSLVLASYDLLERQESMSIPVPRSKRLKLSEVKFVQQKSFSTMVFGTMTQANLIVVSVEKSDRSSDGYLQGLEDLMNTQPADYRITFCMQRRIAGENRPELNPPVKMKGQNQEVQYPRRYFILEAESEIIGRDMEAGKQEVIQACQFVAEVCGSACSD
jgi:hypothetical protein